MNRKIDLAISFNSQNSLILIESLNKLKYFNYEPPTLITTITSEGFTEFEGDSDWIDKWVLKAKTNKVKAYWGDIFDHKGFIIYNPKKQVTTIKINDFEINSFKSVLDIFTPLPWTVANFYDIFNGDENNAWNEYIPPGFIHGHGGHGWACAFKGEGHNHLVSRRWLEYHPWYLIRDEEHDISFVQFHDLDADPAEALEQAIPGHRAMSMYGIGGYIGKTHPFSNDLRGIYLPDERNLRVVIPAGKEITYSEMSDYCAARYFQAFREGDIDLLSFVFIVAEEAQPYIHDLWLRDIEVFGFAPKGEEIRLDENYHPDYEPPSWVKRLQLREKQNEIEQKKLELDSVEKRIANLTNRIKNFSVGSSINYERRGIKDVSASRTRELEQELRKQRVVRQNLEKQIALLESNPD